MFVNELQEGRPDDNYDYDELQALSALVTSIEVEETSSSESQKEFLQHCTDNNLDKVRHHLFRGVDVNTVSEDGRWSGLTIAAEKNYTELLEILLSHSDIKINKTTKWYDRSFLQSQLTSLMFACDAGNPATVSRLVEVPGLDINHQDECGQTAAHFACIEGFPGHTECVRILAGTGRMDWNKRDKRGRTPLYWALENGHSDVMDIIVQQPNIDYNVKDEFGEALGYTAVNGGNVKCVETLAALERFD